MAKCADLCAGPHDHDHHAESIVNPTNASENIKLHLCEKEHYCNEDCNHEGVCQIQYISETKVWEDSISSQEYEYIKPLKSWKQCKVTIPAGSYQHDGDHNCGNQHTCDANCPECGNFCKEVLGHEGRHKTVTHRNKEFCYCVSRTSEGTRVEGEGSGKKARLYKPGDTFMLETCGQQCARKGRAHYHLSLCPGDEVCAALKYPRMVEHCTEERFYPNLDRIYDKYLCEKFWAHHGWHMASDDVKISQCNYYCPHSSHPGSEPSFCDQAAWHTKSENLKEHHFPCHDFAYDDVKIRKCNYYCPHSSHPGSEPSFCDQAAWHTKSDDLKEHHFPCHDFAYDDVKISQCNYYCPHSSHPGSEPSFCDQAAWHTKSENLKEHHFPCHDFAYDDVKIRKCNYYCPHSSHPGSEPSFCDQAAWHTKSDDLKEHHFPCHDFENRAFYGMQLCFCIDTTSSMGKYNYQSKFAITRIINDSVRSLTEFKKDASCLKFAIVSYQDHDYPPPIVQCLLFTTAEVAIQFLGTLRAREGSKDPPEAVLDGLDAVANLPWEEDKLKIVFHILDCPPHGKKFYSGRDSYPDGCPCQLEEGPILQKMKTLDISYHVIPLTNRLNLMITEFEKHIKVIRDDLKATVDLPSIVSQSVCKAIEDSEFIATR
jgi:hypothetical protein